MERNRSVSLRPWTMEDKEDLARLCNGVDRSYVRNSLPFPYTEKDAEWWIGMTLDRDGKDGVFRAVCLDGKVVGNISVEQGTDVYRCGAEIGYMLDRGVWSRGIMTEAAGLICKEAWRLLDILRITGRVYEPNRASRRVLEKNGFELEGLLKQAVDKNGNIYNLCIYGKVKPKRGMSRGRGPNRQRFWLQDRKRRRILRLLIAPAGPGLFQIVIQSVLGDLKRLAEENAGL